jgi:DnaJ-class molecular chaperone
MTYRDFKRALDILGISERASLPEIRSRHRNLIKRHHPDTHSDPSDSEATQRINAAYRIVSAYCSGYRFDFSEAEFLEQTPEERLRRQFATDPLWGDGRPGAGD